MRYTIGEMAGLMGVAPSALRYYDKEGLLPFVERTEGGSRVFKDSDYEALKVIDYLKRAGLSIKEIRAFIDMAEEGDATIEARLALFEERRAAVERQIAGLEETLALLNFKCWYYRTALEAGTEEVVRGIACDAVPDEHKDAKRTLDITHRQESVRSERKQSS